MNRQQLALLFEEELFLPEMKARTKEEALKELLDTFVKKEIIRNKSIILEMLHKRESLGSTGIGKGVALPHGRSTAVPDVHIAFGLTKDGIDYESIDRKPVNMIFMILAPPQEQTNKYLPALGKLVEIVSENKNRKKIAKVTSFYELIEIIEGDESD